MFGHGEHMDFWSNFWDLIWFAIVVFAFVAYLVVLIGIVLDLVRDRELSGWWKAVWAVFLVFLPFVTAIVYLIGRGGGMADRGAAEALDARSATDAYIRSLARNPAEEIATAKSLREQGTISEAEYEALKAEALKHATRAD